MTESLLYIFFYKLFRVSILFDAPTRMTYHDSRCRRIAEATGSSRLVPAGVAGGGERRVALLLGIFLSLFAERARKEKFRRDEIQ